MSNGNFGIDSGTYGDEGRNVALGVLAGLGVGLLVGAAAALLLTPTTGEEVRNEVGKSMDDLNDKINLLTKEVSYNVTNAVSRLRAQMAKNMSENGSDGDESVG